MEDLSVDELANCPVPDDALMLLAPATADAVRGLSEAAQLEVCKTIVALADVVAKTHQPSIVSLRVALSDAGLSTVVEAGGKNVYQRIDTGIVAAVTGGVVGLARAESRLRKGFVRAQTLEHWGQTLVDAGMYLMDIGHTAREIASEAAREANPVEARRGLPINPVRVEDSTYADLEFANAGLKADIEAERGDETHLCGAIHPSRPPGPDRYLCVREKGHSGECAPAMRNR